MTRALRTLAGALALGVSAAAQSPDGAVDLSGPPPKTVFDGKPDLSGVWRNVDRGGTADAEAVTLNDTPYATFADIGAGYRIGLPLHPWAAALKSERVRISGTSSHRARCEPFYNQQANANGFPRQIVHAPGVIAVLYDTPRGSRQIFTDGRARRENGTQGFTHGYSRGAWQGDTLVVLTTHFRDGVWLDTNGSPLTAAGRTVERFHRVNVGTIEIEQTIDDEKAYARPFTTRLTWRLMPDIQGIAARCPEH
jgi:hypothetical protein